MDPLASFIFSMSILIWTPIALAVFLVLLPCSGIFGRKFQILAKSLWVL